MSKIVDKDGLKAFRQRNDSRYVLDGEYSPETSVGYADVADNLFSDVYQPQDLVFTAQQSGGKADIITSEKAAKLTKLKGLSVYYNQLLDNGDLLTSEDVQGVTAASSENIYSDWSVSDGVLTLTIGTPTTDINNSNNRIRLSTTPVNIINGHYYYYKLSAQASHSFDVLLRFTDEYRGIITAPPLPNSNKWANMEIVERANTNLSNTAYFLQLSNLTKNSEISYAYNVWETGDTIKIRGCVLIDLTEMFGKGCEPTSVEEFKSRFSLLHYPYSAGEFQNAVPHNINSYSANLYPAENTSFFVIPDKDYAITGVTSCNIVELDVNGDTIKTTPYSSLGTVYALDNDEHIGYADSDIKGIRLNINTAKVKLDNVVSNGTVYFGLAHSKPYRGNKAHSVSTYLIDNPNLNSIGYYYDEKLPDGTGIKRIGFLTAQTGDIGDEITLTGAMADTSVLSSAGGDIGTVSGTTLTLTKDISNVDIFFVLETPVPVSGTGYEKIQYANDYGIQQFEYGTLCPQPCEFLYQSNLKDFIQRIYEMTAGDPNEITIGVDETQYRKLITRSVTSLTPKDFEGVTNIGKSAFKDCADLQTVTMGDDVVVIEESAFEKCQNLAVVNLSKNLTTIGKSAFKECAIHDLVIPKNVTIIGEEAFDQTWVAAGQTDVRLATVAIAPDSELSEIGQYAFRNQHYLKKFVCPATVTKINGQAFYGCRSLSLIMLSTTPPNAVTTFAIDPRYVYVPYASIATYKAATYWSGVVPTGSYADRGIYPLVATYGDLTGLESDYSRACVIGSGDYKEYTYSGGVWTQVQ